MMMELTKISNSANGRYYLRDLQKDPTAAYKKRFPMNWKLCRRPLSDDEIVQFHL